MTFIAPSPTAGTRGASSLFGRRAPKSNVRPMLADEDGARRALGSDGELPAAALADRSIEHLARIALG